MSDCDRNYFELCNDVLGELYFDEVDTFDELEDIEEELDIQLTTLFGLYNKMCEQKFVYVKIGSEIRCEYNDYFVVDFKNKEIIGMEYEPMNYYEFQNHGKTWALTREELENE